MDRSMKVMFGMMTLAICLMAFSMIGNQSQQVYAGEYAGGADRGTEPTIVWFGVSAGDFISESLYHRLWSDGLLQQRYVYSPWGSCTGYDATACGGWFDVEPPAGVDGVACGADLNNDSVVDVSDLLVVMDKWGANTVCEPTYECIDLNNLPSGVGG